MKYGIMLLALLIPNSGTESLLGSPLNATVACYLSGPQHIKTQPRPDLRKLAHNIALKHGIEPNLFNAIISQESSWRISAFNKRTRDYGLAQISERNVVALNLDRKRLLSDPAYNLEQGALILKWFKAKYGHEPLWWTRYNVGSGTLGPKRGTIAVQYSLKVLKHYNGPTVAINGPTVALKGQ